MFRKTMKSATSTALAIALICSMMPAQQATSAAAKVKKMTLNKTKLSLEVGDTATIKVKKVTPKKASKAVAYKSSKKSVASVSKKGKVTAKKAGSANITVTSKSNKKVKKIVKVTVRDKAENAENLPNGSVNPPMTDNNAQGGSNLPQAGNGMGNGSGTNNEPAKTEVPASTEVPAVSDEPQETEAPEETDEPEKTATPEPNLSTYPPEKTAMPEPSLPTYPPEETATPKPSVPTYPPGYIYKQRSKMVTRWYDEGVENGHHHNGYKNNNFAIWMIGSFDNNYDSTDDEKLNEGIYAPDLDDYKGKELTVKGEFMYEGHDQPTVFLQLNCTRPVDYPIVWKWEKGASKKANEFAAGLKMKGVNGSENVNHGEWAKVYATFTIPADAVNEDKDEDTGESFGIYLYFPNRPGGALLYRSDNTFHFRNFEIRGGGDHVNPTPKPTSTPTPTPTPTPIPFVLPDEAMKDYADFNVGTVVNREKTLNKSFTQLAAQQFDVVSFENEMKGCSLIDVGASQAAVAEKGEGNVECQFGTADDMVQWAIDNGLKVHGHVLFWEYSMANAFFYKGYDENGELVDRATLEERMANYANQVIGHFEKKFPGEVIAWDVVNEAVNADASDRDEATGLYLYNTDKFYQIFGGGEYIKYAFQCAQEAKKAANADILLYYNDFACFMSPKTDRIIELINYLNPEGGEKLLDCMGMEGCVLTYWPNPSEFSSAMNRFADLGIKVGLNEVCIRLSPQYSSSGSEVTDADIEAHAQKCEDMFKVYCDFNKAHPGTLTNVSILALFDRPDLMSEANKPEADRDYDYTVYGTHSGLFDENYRAKDAFNRVIEVLKTYSNYNFEVPENGVPIDISTYVSGSGTGGYNEEEKRVEISDSSSNDNSQGSWALPEDFARTIKTGDLVTFRVQGYNYGDSGFRFWLGSPTSGGCTPVMLLNEIDESLAIDPKLGYPCVKDEAGNVLEGAAGQSIQDDASLTTYNQMAINADPDTKAFDITFTFKAGTSQDDVSAAFTHLTLKYVFSGGTVGYINGLVIKNIYYIDSSTQPPVVDSYEATDDFSGGRITGIKLVNVDFSSDEQKSLKIKSIKFFEADPDMPPAPSEKPVFQKTDWISLPFPESLQEGQIR